MTSSSSSSISINWLDDDVSILFRQDYSPPAPPPPPPHPPSASCEADLGGVGSLDTICKVVSDVNLTRSIYVSGKGSFYVLQNVSILCSGFAGCEFGVNVSGNFSLGEDARVNVGSFEVDAENAVFEIGSVVNVTGLGGDPPEQTSGTPQGVDGAGGGHGGRGAACLVDDKKLPDDVWGGDAYAWSSLAKPLSYGSRGGTTSREVDYGGGGGGKVMVVVKSNVEMNGGLFADGGDGGPRGGGGSGGSVYIKAYKMTGTGKISACGGNGFGGGGGGRIATDVFSRHEDPKIYVHGGNSLGCPSNAGAAGTFYDSVPRSLIVDNYNMTTDTDTLLMEFPYQPLLTSIFIRNSAKAAVPLLWSRVQVQGQISLLDGAILSFGLAHYALSEFEETSIVHSDDCNVNASLVLPLLGDIPICRVEDILIEGLYKGLLTENFSFHSKEIMVKLKIEVCESGLRREVLQGTFISNGNWQEAEGYGGTGGNGGGGNDSDCWLVVSLGASISRLSVDGSASANARKFCVKEPASIVIQRGVGGKARLAGRNSFPLVSYSIWGCISPGVVSKGTFSIAVVECPLGTYKNVTGSDRSLCFQCPADELPHRALYVPVRGGIAETPCPYKCVSDRYHMPNCYTALEELIYTFGGPWLFGLLLLGLLILLALVLSVARMKFVGLDESPGPAPTQQGSQMDHSFPFLESLNEVLETNRVEDSQGHVYRMYFMGQNTFSDPWHLPHTPPEQVKDIVYEGAFNRFVDEINGLATYQWWEGSMYSILVFIAYPLAWSWQQWRRKINFQRIREFVRSEYDHACLRSCRSRALYEGLKVASTSDLMLAYVDFFLGGDEKRSDLPPGLHQRFPLYLLFGGDGSYMSPFSLQSDNTITTLMNQAVPPTAWYRFVAGLNAQLRLVIRGRLRAMFRNVVAWLETFANPTLKIYGVRVDLAYFEATSGDYYQYGLVVSDFDEPEFISFENTDTTTQEGQQASSDDGSRDDSREFTSLIQHQNAEKSIITGKRSYGRVLDLNSLQAFNEKRDIFFPLSYIIHNTKPVGHQDLVGMVISMLLLGDFSLVLLTLLQLYSISFGDVFVVLFILPLGILLPFPAGINALFSQGPRRSAGLARMYALWNITSFVNVVVAFICGYVHYCSQPSTKAPDFQPWNMEESEWWIFPLALVLCKCIQTCLLNWHVANLEIQDRKISWFRWISFDYRVPLGFGRIAGGLDHVNPVIRLPIEHGISRELFQRGGFEITGIIGQTKYIYSGTMAGVDIDTLTIEQYLALSREKQAPGVVKPEIRGNVNFEIKSQFMRELRKETFSGNKNEDAHDHVDRVLNIVSLFSIREVTQVALLLRVFPFTLTGTAKRWVDRLTPGTVNTWDLFERAFIQRMATDETPSSSTGQCKVVNVDHETPRSTTLAQLGQHLAMREKRPKLREIMISMRKKSARRSTEMKEWIKKLQENAEIDTRNQSASLKT
ncbi:hypothetical protein Tco_0954830 [Tanacetum coccineum]|uniref:DUF8003 domain-containing protein n=1 Tax=Tanacetum coccineum TaxID=301880 RepID=A0ABQ5E5I6_9ASTR